MHAKMIAMKNYDTHITKQLHATPDENEIETAKILVDAYGWRILFLAENIAEGVPTPDFEAGNVRWEIKTPTKAGKYTLPHAIKAAAHQSPNVILSLVKFEGNEQNAIRRAKKEFDASKRARRMKIITKQAQILDFTK
jgi:hypothetical protein